MPSVSRMCARCFFILLPAVVALTFGRAPGAAAEAPAEPHLVRSSLTLAPTEQQLNTLPVFRREWWLTPPVARELAAVLTRAEFAPEFVDALTRSVRIRADGSGLIVPEPGMLERFTPAQRTRWLVLLGLHGSNHTYRWPLAVRADMLDRLARDESLREAVARVRRWGLPSGDRILFGDLWALEDAWPEPAARRRFYQAAFSTESLFLKLNPEEQDDRAGHDADYWHGHGRYRAIEPFYNAVRRVEGHDRIDLAHLLPRFARGLVYTFPPEFGTARDLAVEGGLVVADFFTTSPEQPAVLDEGFAAWLARECTPVTGPLRFGDVFVFEDPARTRWPYAAVYLAEGIVFAREPTLFGAWTFLPREAIAGLNPRLGAGPVRIFRRNDPPATAASPPIGRGVVPPRWREPVPLRPGAPGPWGRLASYGVLLAPPGDMLAGMPEPSRRPEWTLRMSDPEPLLDAVEGLAMPDETRRELGALFAGVRAGPTRNITLRPSLELALRVPGPVRARLFRYLVTGTTADAYAQTIKIASRVPAEEWFAEDALPAGVRDDVLRLTYPLGGAFAISDYGALFEVLPRERDERLAAMRTVFRTPALIVLLEKPTAEEIPALAAYWNLGQQKDVTTLLESFAANDDVRYLDIVHLLPPRAREFMNLYTLADVNVPTASCYWTALNFDVDDPDPRLLIPPTRHGNQADLAWKKLQEEYVEVAAPGRLGDVIAYREKSGRNELTHVCAFVADDVVFTKNGFGLMAPWCLMRLPDVDALYFDGERIERRYFRRRP